PPPSPRQKSLPTPAA
ncbi:unnamed protein product, partial [Rotaria socialis]